MTPTDPVEGLVAALEHIAQPPDCGCRPCRGQCRSESAMQIDLEVIRDLACDALAAYRAAPKPVIDEAWRPIESAPRDGTPVLLWKAITEEHYVAAYINGGCGPGWCTPDGFEILTPTHWRPLPDPPALAKEIEI